MFRYLTFRLLPVLRVRHKFFVNRIDTIAINFIRRTLDKKQEERRKMKEIGERILAFAFVLPRFLDSLWWCYRTRPPTVRLSGVREQIASFQCCLPLFRSLLFHSSLLVEMRASSYDPAGTAIPQCEFIIPFSLKTFGGLQEIKIRSLGKTRETPWYWVRDTSELSIDARIPLENYLCQYLSIQWNFVTDLYREIYYNPIKVFHFIFRKGIFIQSNLFPFSINRGL